MNDIAIKVENLTKVYKLYEKPIDRLKESLNLFNKKYHKDFHALKDISLEVKKGETIGIIGKNGSGKSTLLKIITGVLSQTHGSIDVNGQISALLELGTGFNPEYTGIENIYLNGTMRGYTREKMDEKINGIMEFADIGDFIYQQVKTYSSGMFARLAFAVMISFKPDILIVDEALSVGDIFFQQKCNMYMKENMKGVTKLLVTHDMNSIANMADRAIVLSNGENIYEGDPLKAIEFYTKSMHNEVFLSENNKDDNEDNLIRKDNELNWNFIDQESLSGALDVKVVGYNYKVNGEIYKGYMTKGDKVDIDLLVQSNKDINHLIFGYIVNDKYGNAIFGENTLSSGFGNLGVKGNKRYCVRLSIDWPEIQQNDYFITLGIGDGTHAFQHTIQCWAHNTIQIKNITVSPVHALFNNKIKKVQINEIM